MLCKSCSTNIVAYSVIIDKLIVDPNLAGLTARCILFFSESFYSVCKNV